MSKETTDSSLSSTLYIYCTDHSVFLKALILLPANVKEEATVSY